MNGIHLRAILWLRWRILVNRIKKAKGVGNLLLALLALLGVAVATLSFLGSIMIGVEVLEQGKPIPVMVMWIVPTLGFTFFWIVGLLTDLQRSDAMSLKNLLHLPVSLRWVFLYNYFSSFVSVTIAIFLPSMLGFWIAMMVAGVPWAPFLLPLLLGYFFLVTALTYQLRGWLGALMQDKRRGRNVIALVTILFALLLQVPNLFNIAMSSRSREAHLESRQEQTELLANLEDAEQGTVEYEEAKAALTLFQEERLARNLEAKKEADHTVVLVLQIIPIGWLPYGARAAFEGRPLPMVLGALGYLAIAAASLGRSYRRTLATTTGVEKRRRGEPAREPEPRRSSESPLIERVLPFVSERTAGVAFAGMVSMLRSPEVKMVLLGPLILLGLFGLMIVQHPEREALADLAPLVTLGAAATGFLGIVQLLQNQFGLARAGFRAYLLSPAPRDHIIVGKNLALAPLALGVGGTALVLLRVLVPVPAPYFIGAWFQLVSGFLLLCMVGNMISLMAPMRLKEHTLRAEGGQWRTILWQLAGFLFVPLAMVPLLLPAAVEFLLSLAGKVGPMVSLVFPVLHGLGLVVVYLVYRWLVARQGELLQQREQHVLDCLTRR